MAKKNQSRGRRSEDVLATLITSTRTSKRKVSLVEFARILKQAIAEAGSLETVAERIDISPRMLKQFLLVHRLTPVVRALVANRQIDSVDAVGYLVPFEAKQQEFLATQLVEGKIQTSDLRAIRQVFKERPQEPLSMIITRVLASRTKKVYVLEFIFRGDISRETVERKVRKVVSNDGLAGVEREGSFGRVVLTPDGLARMRVLANEQGTSLAKTMAAIINK